MKKLAAALLLLSAVPAHAQVVQSGNVTPGHPTRWISNGVVGDAGTAANGSITSLGVTNNGGPGICINSAAITGAYNQLCFSVTTNGGVKISSYALGGATSPGITFDINGSLQGFLTVTGLPVTPDAEACFNDTSGNLKQCSNSFIGFANPTAHVGLAAVNGVAATAMRSDAAPALDQGISPTWTGPHTFSNTATFNGNVSFTSGVAFNHRIITTSGAVTVAATDAIIAVNKVSPSSTAFTLPTVASRNGLALEVFDYAGTGGNMTFTPNGSEKIMGLSSWTVLSGGSAGTGGTIVLIPDTTIGGWLAR